MTTWPVRESYVRRDLSGEVRTSMTRMERYGVSKISVFYVTSNHSAVHEQPAAEAHCACVVHVLCISEFPVLQNIADRTIVGEPQLQQYTTRAVRSATVVASVSQHQQHALKVVD